MEKAIEIEPVTELFSMKGLLKARMGKKTESYELLEQLDSTADNPNSLLMYRSFIFAEMGETNKSLDCLEQAFECHNAAVLRLTVDIRLKKLRQEVRFKKLVNKVLYAR